MNPTLFAGEVPDLHRAVALRNQLAHGDAEVDDAIVWGVLAGPLPSLLATLRSL